MITATTRWGRPSSAVPRRRTVRVSAGLGRAVVLGTGMGGLVAAQRLSKHYDEVVCIEHDREPRTGDDMMSSTDTDSSTNAISTDAGFHGNGNSNGVGSTTCQITERRGVPQFHHVHALLGRGAGILDDSFGPGYRQELLRRGGRLVDWYKGIVIAVPPAGVTFLENNAAAAAARPISFYSASRMLLETTARHMLTSNPRVKVRYGRRASGLVFETRPDGRRTVTAVKIKSSSHTHRSGHDGDGAAGNERRGHASDDGGATAAGARHSSLEVGSSVEDATEEEALPAALVIDTTGRSSAGCEWLREGGCEVPPVRVVDAGVGYVSRHYKLSPEAERRLQGTEIIVALSIHPHNQFAVLQHIEGGDWLVGVAGYTNRSDPQGLPPRDDDALLPWVESKMWCPEIVGLVRGAVPLAPSSKFFGVKNTHHRYDDVTLPEGLVFLGDSVCAFNPVYGQGMTVAAVEAELLDDIIARRLARAGGEGGGGAALDGLSNEHARACAAVVEDAWGLAAGLDSLPPWAMGTETKHWTLRLRMGYVAEVLRLCSTDPEVHRVMSSVWNMFSPASALLEPWIAVKVVRSMAVNALHSLLPGGKALPRAGPVPVKPLYTTGAVPDPAPAAALGNSGAARGGAGEPGAAGTAGVGVGAAPPGTGAASRR